MAKAKTEAPAPVPTEPADIEKGAQDNLKKTIKGNLARVANNANNQLKQISLLGTRPFVGLTVGETVLANFEAASAALLEACKAE